MENAKCRWSDIDAIAVTYGPGLLGSLLIGVLSARTLAVAKNKPLYAINHVEAHPYAAFITETNLPSYLLPKGQPEFPLLALVASGGHCQLVLFESHLRYHVLGQTLDDAVGEAFDKVAKILGLPYPGGPSIALAAQNGDSTSVKLPKARLLNPYDFSFSGLKTATLRAAQDLAGKDYTLPSSALPGLLSDNQKNNLAASFQQTAITILIDALNQADREFAPRSIVVAGGVAANSELRKQADARLRDVIYPDIKLCTDNAAMIAARGYYQAQKAAVADAFHLATEPSLQM
jgi:N6-L-threonylcarbamoyladenine synthase